MSDNEEHSSTEDDFSASEDEWKPGKTNRPATDDESDDDDSDFEGNASSSKRRESKSQKGSSKSDSVTKQTKKRKSTGTSLRTKLFNKYKPPPKTLRNQMTPAKPLRETPCSAAHSTTKSHRTVNKPDSSESDSSVDDYLVNPDEIDLQSSFFDIKPSTSGEANAGPPQFDCNAGMKLSDSDEDDGVDDDDDEESYSTKRSVRANSAKPVDLGYLQDFAKKLDKAKVLYKKHKDRSLLAEEPKVDVSLLLAMGESTSNSTSTVQPKKTKNPKRQSKKTQPNKAASDTDSDWVEVEAEDGVACAPQSTDTLADGIQVCVGLPQRQRKDKKAIDLEAVLKRQLNRVIKENQIILHKVSLLGHIYNGFYLNKVASNIHLMPVALKLLPSKNVYPSGQTEIKYFQSMVTWFKTAIKILDNRMFPQIKIDPVRSLSLQMKNRHAVCRRDFILMFVILLRAMGMQCRLVVNLMPIPLKPPQSSLCSLKMKPANDDDKMDAKNQTDEKKSVKKEPIKSPPLSREAKEDLLRKVDFLEKEIARKKREKLKPKPSFEDELETKALPLVKAAKLVNTSSIEGKPSCSQKSSATKIVVKREDMKRKSLDNTQESEKKKKKAGSAQKKSPYFPDSAKQPEVSLQVHSKSLDNPPSIPISTKRKKTAATAPKKSPYFPDSSKSVEPSLELHPNSFEDQPSISINTKASVSPKIVKKPNISRSKSPKTYISSEFLQTKARKAQDSDDGVAKVKRERSPNPTPSAPVKAFISSEFLKARPNRNATARVAIDSKIEKPSPRRLRSKNKLTVPQLDGSNDVPKTRRRKQPLKKTQPNSEDDFEPSPPKRSKAVEKLDRQVLSPETADECTGKKKYINMWVEVYSELEAQWVCVDLFKGKVHCVESIRKTVTPSTLAYVFAFNNDSTLKDVTARYCPQWATVVRKGRVEQAWLDEAVRQYVPTYRSQIDLTEDMDLRRVHLDKPLPSAIMEYKDNPLYALERHLLKFQAIYPPNAPTLGFVRGEAVYPRECVHTLHSREIWLKSARVVKPGEQAYKIVKARPKWDKFTSTVIKDQPLEIFGYWQTQDYEPPTAENGIVPRNAYGNVELFKECMLPKKTVHLHLPGLNRTCKKLGIDCAPAVIGFDFHQGSCHPLYDGFVVCEEFAEKAADAWEKDQQEAERKEQEKYEARVYGNWKRLIKGLLIKERLKLKYNF